MLNDMLKEIGKDNVVDNLELSKEMIKPQPNDWVVPAIENMFKKIQDEVSKLGNNIKGAYFKNKNIKKYYAEIDKLVKDRFGIPIHHAYAPIPYAVYTVAPKSTFNTIKRFNLGIIGSIANNAKDSNTDVVDMTKADQRMQAMANLTKANAELEKTLNSDGVIIDLDKAVIKNLPKDYYIQVITSPYILFEKFNFSPLEVTALLLHEVGHAFTHLEYSYKNVALTTNLVDTITENVAKNKSTKDILKIVYQDVLDGNPDDVKDGNLITIGLKTINKYQAYVMYNNNNFHSDTDSEQLADQFSARMGLGNELILSLNTIIKTYGYRPPAQDPSTGEYLLVFGVTAMYIIMAASALGSVIGAIFGIIISAVLALKLYREKSPSSTYDDDYRRLKRIRNDMVRQMRLYKLDKKIIQSYLDTIDYTDKLLAKLKVPKYESIITKIYYRMHTSKVNMIDVKYIEQLTEDLMENDLHTASMKLKMV